jgi:hypothetical protein
MSVKFSIHLSAIETPAGLLAGPTINSIGTAAPAETLCGTLASTLADPSRVCGEYRRR